MKVFANTDVGLVRQLNEDDYCIAHNANDEWMAIVCDGIGGAKAGEVATGGQRRAKKSEYATQLTDRVMGVDIRQETFALVLKKIVKLTTGFVKI